MGEVAFDGDIVDFFGLLDNEDIVRSPDIGVRNLENDWSGFSGTPLVQFKSDETTSEAVKYYGIFNSLLGGGGEYLYGSC